MVSLATSTAYEEIGQISSSSSTPFDTVSADDALSPSECASPSAPHSPKRPRNGVEDTLTCGSCLRDFSLSDITKFIDHKAINGCEFAHKKCKLDFAFTGDDDDSDCCSCIDFDLSSGNEKMATSPEASRTAQSFADSQVTVIADTKELEDEKTLTIDLKQTKENEKTDLENANKADTPEEEKVEQAAEETAEAVESMEIASTKSDDKENRPSGNHSELETIAAVQSADSKKESNQIVLSELSCSNQEVSTSLDDIEESRVESSAAEEVSQSYSGEKTVESDAADEAGRKSTTKRPVRTLQHNHLCRHYRRLCKHFQRSLLARALSDAHTNTGETET